MSQRKGGKGGMQFPSDFIALGSKAGSAGGAGSKRGGGGGGDGGSGGASGSSGAQGPDSMEKTLHVLRIHFDTGTSFAPCIMMCLNNALVSLLLQKVKLT